MFGVDQVNGDVSGIKNMKKFFMVIVMVAVSVMANAQMIVDMGGGKIILENGVVLDAMRIPNACGLRRGEDINAGISRVQMQERIRLQREAAQAAYSDMYADVANAAYYGGGAYYGGAVAPVAVGGYESSGITIGNEHWGVSTSSSKSGAYESGSTNIRVGGFHIGTYKSGMSKAAKKAAQRYSNMKNNSVAGSARSTSYNNVKEVNINDLMRNYK